MQKLKALTPTLLAVLGCILMSVLYFSPVLRGKKINQSDIVQYVGMAHEQNEYRAQHHTEPYWTDSAFGGMPTYQLGAHYPYDWIGALDDVIRFLPRPADYLFLYLIGFFALLRVLGQDEKLSFIGALFFGFSTYLIVILGVGHNAKAHAIGYMPWVLAGSILLFRRQYGWGGLLTALAWGLEINANHFQMTYYFLFLLAAVWVVYALPYLKDKDWNSLFRIKMTYLAALLLALGMNATNLLATKEYADTSTRGTSELRLSPEGKPKASQSGLNRDYITEYSYGLFESANLIAPRLMGGSMAEPLSTDSRLYQFVVEQGGSAQEAADMAQQAPTYWGDQPIVAAPAYIGIGVFFLFVFALFHDRRRIKWGFTAAALLALMLSWGKNFPVLTDFMIDYMPLYNKFRAVSSIQVILELALPVVAVMGLDSLIRVNENRLKHLYYAVGTTLGFIVILWLCKGQWDFSHPNDSYYLRAYGALGQPFVQAIQADRATLYSADLLRSTFIVLLMGGLIWAYQKEKIKAPILMGALAFLVVADLFTVDKRYVNENDFAEARLVDHPFEASPADEAIWRDKSRFRVFDPSEGLNGARTSYFHASIGGYHAAKPRFIQDLYDYQIAKNNTEVLNMLNVKYLILTDSTNQPYPIPNPDANGNAWFVSKIQRCPNADAVMKAMLRFNSKQTALITTEDAPKNLANSWAVGPEARIQLTTNTPNHLAYQSQNTQAGLAVFSEWYYPKGWQANLDGKAVNALRVNYGLRALLVPAGTHRIEWRFVPTVVEQGSKVVLAANILAVLAALGLLWRRRSSIMHLFS